MLEQRRWRARCGPPALLHACLIHAQVCVCSAVAMRRRHAAAGKLRGNKKVSTQELMATVTVTVTVSHGALQLFQFAIMNYEEEDEEQLQQQQQQKKMLGATFRIQRKFR